MPIDWRPFVEFVSRHDSFLITSHVRPDGDALGCEMALCLALKQLGKRAAILNVDEVADRYDFLDPDHIVEKFEPPGEQFKDFNAFVIVDTGTWMQLGPLAEFARNFQGEKAVIDHHVTQDDLGAIQFVDATAEAAGRLVHQAVCALGVKLTPEIATALFVAVSTDTGWFRHSSVTAATHQLAAELMEAGVKSDFLYQKLFERHKVPRLRVMGTVLARLSTACDGQLAYSSILAADLPPLGATYQDAEDMTNFTVGLVGTPIAALFVELPNNRVKISLRARQGYEVGSIAEQFGGGGHKQAAGATVNGKIDEIAQQVLERIESALRA